MTVLQPKEKPLISSLITCWAVWLVWAVRWVYWAGGQNGVVTEDLLYLKQIDTGLDQMSCICVA